MKANELMIGDLVYYNHTEDGIAPYKEVICIKAEDLCRDACIIETHYEPIPLTPEILEKNRMKEFEHRNPWQGENLIKKWYHKSGDYYVSLYQVGNEQSYTFGDGSRPTRICNIHYVHELQHALRLCGINKEIKL